MEEMKNRKDAVVQEGFPIKPQMENLEESEVNCQEDLPERGTVGGISMPHDKGYKKSLSRPAEFLHFLKKYVGQTG